ncbi:MAG: prepilin-type N-terminal cleavage/methylation domain-containing protein [bacterium]|nr:prepilin-type N-terminal cleavage/methylation domain-containing protein [Candidatus Sumerlaeota bacterium]
MKSAFNNTESVIRRAFTLIELLIVVAIIAILAAIAVPNFMEAQTRAKVSRTKNDMRVIATAMESYASDNTMKYPPEYHDKYSASICYPKSFSHLTTPIAYMSSIPKDTFKSRNKSDWAWSTDFYWYYNWLGRYGKMINVNKPPWSTAGQVPWYDAETAWMATSLGPDQEPGYPAIYDPTNGTVSWGDITRFGPSGQRGS